MNILVRTDHNIDGSAELNEYINENLSEVLERFKSLITRVEVHLSDENAGKTGGMDKRCLIEARLANHNPVIIRHNANSIHQVINESASKLLRSIGNIVDRSTSRTGLSEFTESQESI